MLLQQMLQRRCAPPGARVPLEAGAAMPAEVPMPPASGPAEAPVAGVEAPAVQEEAVAAVPACMNMSYA